MSEKLTLDYVTTDEDITQQHYAFLVSEDEFDQILAGVKQRSLDYWGGPIHQNPGQINRWDDGRGVCFDDPDGHSLEILTRSYGSEGTSADRPNPLVAEIIEN